MIRIQSAALLFCLLLTGCSSEPEEPPAEAFIYEYNTYKDQHPNCSDEQQNGCVELSYTWPEISGPDSLTDSLMSSMASFIFEVDTASFSEQHFDSLAHLWYSMYDSVRARLDNYPLEWEEQKMVSVIYDTPELVSLEYYAFQFSGGAHPTTEWYYRMFEKPSGRRIGMDDLFSAENRGVATILAESAFRRYHGLSLQSSLVEEGFWFEDRGFYLPDNLALISDGLLIQYNPYEVAPYSEGPTRLVLPYSEIDSLLNPEYLPRNMWQKQETK